MFRASALRHSLWRKLTLEPSAFQIFDGDNSTFIKKTIFNFCSSSKVSLETRNLYDSPFPSPKYLAPYLRRNKVITVGISASALHYPNFLQYAWQFWHTPQTKSKHNFQLHFTCTSANVIYCITCALCKKLYIGETGRRLGDRFREQASNAFHSINLFLFFV